ncbi:hypothetical protein EB118_22580 [bacterium]|nr:hypothetical protein [bacterium]NDC96175.1 hypothetical protein [bacterium]NDD85800.1 hypothetical protein [bacterium]NDG32842.1 hypothetical protein [bacterium]
MSDNYTFAKSMQPQSINDYSPYQDKQSNNYINDLNNGVYTNNGLTLVNFDLGAIYNSQKYTSTEDLTVAIPITMVAAYGSGTGLSANSPGANNVALCSIKSNFVNLIHQADLQINGKTIESTQPFINVARNFQMLSELDEIDLHTQGSTLGFADHLDNYKSMRYTSSGGSGSGISNNRVFGNGTDHQTTYSINQNGTVINSALQYKMGRYIDTSGNANGLGSVLSTTQMANEARPYFTRSTDVSGSYMIWYDVAVIKLSTIFESLGKIGLVKRFDATVRLWINTGTVGITVGNPNTATASYTMTASNNTFSNTCPLMINYFGTTDAIMATSTTTTVVAGLYIARPPTTSMMGINLALSGASHYLQNCRLYYPQITLQPEKSIQYSESNRNKNVVYRSVVSNLYTNIGVGGTFNALVNAGIVAPCAVLVCPFISASAAGFGDSAWKSPFDTAPALGHPVSLTNFNVSIGGSNVLQSTLNYSYEHFLQQVNLAEQMTSSDFGVSTGLISEDLWRWSKWYFCNVERSAIADKKQPRNVNVTFNNNSSLALDVLIFIFYTDELTIDVETGIVTK